jgi:hypothetical protein
MFGSPNLTRRTVSPSFAATANFLPPSESLRGLLYPENFSPAMRIATGSSSTSQHFTVEKSKKTVKTVIM